MKLFSPRLALILCLAAGLAGPVQANPLHPQEVQDQNAAYQRWWGSEMVWRFDDLPTKAMVAQFRMPYAGAIYPDSKGGCEQVLRKYDRAFHHGRSLAVSFERRDIEIHKQPESRRGLFRTRTVVDTPNWAGHCNGWTAAAIRHAEPKENVVRNGVVFTPSDIKGLMAEMYVFSGIEHLGGMDAAINPATFHVVLANWIGRGQLPIGMDKSVGKEVWNYPIYGYTSASSHRGDRQVEVKTNIGYVHYTNQEYDVAPENHRFLYFHYMLDLNADGEITGGRYFSDSNRIDMLWTPLQPTPGGSPTNKEGNPYLDIKEVLSMWRESAPAEIRAKWYNIDPTEEDRLLESDAETTSEPGVETPSQADFWNQEREPAADDVDE